MIAERFGNQVAAIVHDVSETGFHLTWSGRKKSARDHIAKFSQNSLLVKSADLLSNGTEIIADWKRDGDKIFERFNATKKKILEHYIQVARIIIKKWPESPLVKDLAALESELNKILIT